MNFDTPFGGGRSAVVAAIDPEALDEADGLVRFSYDDRLGNETEGVVMRVDGDLIAFRNVCPHLGYALDCRGGDFLDEEGEAVVCDAHGARFELESGHCEFGPCEGDRLETLRVEVDEASGEILVRRGRRLSL